MYRILIADDEGIMLISLKTMILKKFGTECEIVTAKTGHAAIEMVESIQPDIVFMDIQMPGINGIEAMQTIRTINKSILFIVITAYNKFDYAKDAIEIGVFDFLTKPVSKENVIEVLQRAMVKVDSDRKNKMNNLRIREKLETVIPILENGMINNLLLEVEETVSSTYDNYRELLEIQDNYAYVVLIQFGECYENGVLTNPLGMSMRAQRFYPLLRQIVKYHFKCYVGAVMSNKVVVLIPHREDRVNYEERIHIIEIARKASHELEEQIDAKFRIGIGRTYPMERINISYQEAFQALQNAKSRVIHIEDLPHKGEYVGEYPVETEYLIFEMVKKGESLKARQQANLFFEWMVSNYPEYSDSTKLKVLEIVMLVEREAFLDGAVDYGFLYRTTYLKEILMMNSYEEIRNWFLNKIVTVSRQIAEKRINLAVSMVSKAIAYINQNYRKDISLDDVSREVNISPYYFSKRFKEETGVNFIDYLTTLRIDHAKVLLKENQLSMKEICAQIGYSDPNYFSRIFKKLVNLTPSEYREKVQGE